MSVLKEMVRHKYIELLFFLKIPAFRGYQIKLACSRQISFPRLSHSWERYIQSSYFLIFVTGMT